MLAIDLQLLKDLSTETQPLFEVGTHANLVQVGDVGYFTAVHPLDGQQLWKIDPALGGAQFFADVNSISTVPGVISNLTNVGGVLYFIGNDGIHGPELWKSDGTAAGTVIVKDILPGSATGFPNSLHNVNGTLYFINHFELWKSDGTEAGTQSIQNIGAPLPSSVARSMTNIGDVLYFVGNDNSGLELWRSDGTPTGTIRLTNSPSAVTPPTWLTPTGTNLFFQLPNSANGAELWKTDGAVAGTAMVKNIRAGSQSSSPSHLVNVNVNGTLYFNANDGTSGEELWRSDGTDAGTVRVKDVVAGSSSGKPAHLFNFNGQLFFTARDHNGYELWTSDGTAAGTVMFKDLNSLSNDGMLFQDATPSRNPFFTEVDGTLYFRANHAYFRPPSLWKSDGTPEGTVIAKDFSTTGVVSNPLLQNLSTTTNRSFANISGHLYFIDGLYSFDYAVAGGTGKLWTSNGTSEGTRLVNRVGAGTISSSARLYSPTDGPLYFTTRDAALGVELWASDGTAQGTHLVKDINPGSSNSYPSQPTLVNGVAYFLATGPTGRGLWRTAGDAESTSLVLAGVGWMQAVADTLYFTHDDGVHGLELWKIDHSGAVPELVADVAPGPDSSIDLATFEAVAFDGALIFTAQTSDAGNELWRTDGTSAGTYLLADALPGPTSGAPFRLKVAGDYLFFHVIDAEQTWQAWLWQSDGTVEGTSRMGTGLPSIGGPWEPQNEQLADSNFVASGGRYFFTTPYAHAGDQLWRLDDEAGAILLHDFRAEDINVHVEVNSLVDLGDALYFTVSYHETGSNRSPELWKSDGTVAGTVKVMAINDGNALHDNNPMLLKVLGDRLYFYTGNRLTEFSVWTSDGTAAGTSIIKTFTRSAASFPSPQFTIAGGKLYVTGATDAYGQEIWVADLVETPSLPGDHNRDSYVDGADFLQWQREFAQARLPRGGGGDGDVSGTVDAADLQLWQENFGASAAQPAIQSFSAAAQVAALTASEEFVTLPEKPTQTVAPLRLPTGAFLSLPAAATRPPKPNAARQPLSETSRSIREAAFAASAQTPRFRFVGSELTMNAKSPQLAFDDSSDDSPRSIDEAFETAFDELKLLNVR